MAGEPGGEAPGAGRPGSGSGRRRGRRPRQVQAASARSWWLAPLLREGRGLARATPPPPPSPSSRCVVVAAGAGCDAPHLLQRGVQLGKDGPRVVPQPRLGVLLRLQRQVRDVEVLACRGVERRGGFVGAHGPAAAALGRQHLGTASCHQPAPWGPGALGAAALGGGWSPRRPTPPPSRRPPPRPHRRFRSQR
jgi:hypothetical protein